jgi:hypothetical protein
MGGEGRRGDGDDGADAAGPRSVRADAMRSADDLEMDRVLEAVATAEPIDDDDSIPPPPPAASSTRLAVLGPDPQRSQDEGDEQMRLVMASSETVRGSTVDDGEAERYETDEVVRESVVYATSTTTPDGAHSGRLWWAGVAGLAGLLFVALRAVGGPDASEGDGPNDAVTRTGRNHTNRASSPRATRPSPKEPPQRAGPRADEPRPDAASPSSSLEVRSQDVGRPETEGPPPEEPQPDSGNRTTSRRDPRDPPPGTSPDIAAVFRRLPVSPADQPPVGGIGATGIHVDDIELGETYEDTRCEGESSRFSIARHDRVNVCIRVVHPREKETVSVLWERDGAARRSAVVIKPLHAYRTRAFMALRSEYVGSWTVRVVSKDGVELAARSFEIVE